MYTTEEFIKKSKEKIVDYRNEHYKNVENVKNIKKKDVKIVWISKTLRHMKGLFISHVTDGMYYELTYNGNKKELYIDVYKKEKNIKYVL